jgi:hypothetical protein
MLLPVGSSVLLTLIALRASGHYIGRGIVQHGGKTDGQSGYSGAVGGFSFATGWAGTPMKRKASRGRDDEDDEGDYLFDTGGDSAAKKARTASPGPPPACPFWKRNPIVHMRCLFRQNPKDIAGLKQHLKRSHQQQPHCPICGATFDTAEMRDLHIREQRSCPTRQFVIPGVSETAFKAINRVHLSRVGEVDKLNRIYGILFPGSRLPITPYWENKINEFIAVIRRSAAFFPNTPYPTWQQLSSLALQHPDLSCLTSDYPDEAAPNAFVASQAQALGSNTNFAQASFGLVGLADQPNLLAPPVEGTSTEWDLDFESLVSLEGSQEDGAETTFDPELPPSTPATSVLPTDSASSQPDLSRPRAVVEPSSSAARHDRNCNGEGNCSCFDRGSRDGANSQLGQG